MNDYIERERALAMLHKDEFGTPDERWHPESEIAEAILRVPAADVAPVVRCEACRFWVQNTSPYDGWGWCNNSAVGEKMRYEDFFCAFGWRGDERC